MSLITCAGIGVLSLWCSRDRGLGKSPSLAAENIYLPLTYKQKVIHNFFKYIKINFPFSHSIFSNFVAFLLDFKHILKDNF